MSSMVSPMELYFAARETCLRLYVANGGDAKAEWSIRPYPGTAAIACYQPAYGPPKFSLAMPSFPLDVKLPRWMADLIAAYTVHELLHALWTDWDAVAQSKREGLGNLCNALEDNRIEARASKGDLRQVSEARKLLQALNAHIARRALKTPGFALDDAKQFSFVLGLVIFAEKLDYASELPVDWRARVKPEWLPLFKLALDRFDTLASTADTLQLCRDLQALAASMRKPAQPKPAPSNPPQPVKLPLTREEAARDQEIVEDDDNTSQDVPPYLRPLLEDSEDDDAPGAPGEDDDNEDDASDDASEPADGLDDVDGLDDGEDSERPQEGFPAPLKTDVEDNGDDAKLEDGEVSEDGANVDGPGGMRTGDVAPPTVDEDEPAEDLSDTTQAYSEAHLDDLAQRVARDARRPLSLVQSDAHHMATVLNVKLPEDLETKRGGSPKLASGAIQSPAKLRRHLTLAVKSPERVGVERRQVSGRLDVRNLVGIATGAPNIFRRRIEEEGREAAVTLLLDVSGSMAGGRIQAAKALALHMGDALKAAGVRFEICAFDDRFMETPKPFAKGWATPTQRAVAGLKTRNGTGMLPAMKACAERLLKVGNVTRRILIALTDGQDSFATEANATLCKWCRSRGVEIVGIGLQTYGVARAFDGRAIEVQDCASLSRLGLAQLVKVLDQA